jgi:hypothetical protein
MPVRWRDGGLDPSASPEHQAYVEEVAQRLSAHLKATVHDIMEEDDAKVRKRLKVRSRIHVITYVSN